MIINSILVDDSIENLNTLHTLLLDYGTHYNISFDITNYTNSMDPAIINTTTHLYFLDIDMPKIGGFELSTMIKKANPKSVIIFCSNHDHLVYEAFKFETCFFIRKAHIYEDLAFALSKATEQIHSLYNAYTFCATDKIQTILFSDILYFEVSYNNIFIYCIDGTILQERKTMKKIISEVSSTTFIQTHYSFLVNAQHIECIEDDLLSMKNGEKLPISKSKKKEIRKKYLLFLSRR